MINLSLIIEDINDPNTILSELQIEENETGQVYYTILENNLEDSYNLNAEGYELLDTDNVFYLSFNNEEVQDDSSDNNEFNQTTDTSNMAFLEQVTLPDGTQAYMKRNITNEVEQHIVSNMENETENLIQKSENCKINGDNDDTSSQGTEQNTLENKGDVEIDQTKYKQVDLDDGTVAIIEVDLYDSLLEQSMEEEKIKMNVIPPAKSFICPNENCFRTYSTMHHLRVHMRNHSGTKPYVCPVEDCKKSFSTNYSLKSHSRTHTGEKPYVCETCNKAFKSSGDLQKHVRIHTGEKPFVCPFEGCGRAFTTSNIRKVHIRSHTGERPYVCPEPLCQKAFASATNYKNHIRIHSGEKPYVCPIEGCEKRFTEYSSLYKHQIVHQKSKPVKCEYCTRLCKTNQALVDHKRTVHNIIITVDGTEIMVKMLKEDDDESQAQDEEVGPQILLIAYYKKLVNGEIDNCVFNLFIL